MLDRKLGGRGRTEQRGRARARGFTLMDLVAALAIAGLLACVAIPSYRAQVIRAHRSDARAALLALATAQETFYASCNGYAAVLVDARDTSCDESSLKLPTDVGPGAYTLEVTSSDQTGWTAAATAVADGPQDIDAGCRVLRLTSTGKRTASRADGSANDEECWTR